MHLDASAGGSINTKTAEEVKELIEQMCRNEYNMSNERSMKPAGMLQLDKETAYQKEIDLLKKKLEKVSLEAQVKNVQEVCDFCQENHPNG
ncbi:retrotransposon gag protein, partial [Trifolium medium]|nr:retrotransposon gag protein [Trifolium medium]